MKKEDNKNFDYLLQVLSVAENIKDIENHKQLILYYFPKVKIMFGFNQNNIAHQYDLWEHTLHVIINLPKNLSDKMIYVAALLHDIGKPDTQTKGKRIDDNYMHYYGHPEKSRDILVNEVIPRLLNFGVNIDDYDIMKLIYYVWFHDYKIELRMRPIRKQYYTISGDWEVFKNLLILQCADAEAHIQIPAICERKNNCIDVLNNGLPLWDKCHMQTCGNMSRGK